MSILALWCLALGLGFGWLCFRWDDNHPWMTSLYRLYLRITGELHKYIAAMDAPFVYEVFIERSPYNITYIQYLRAYEFSKEDLLHVSDVELKHMAGLFVRGYWKFFVAGLVCGGVLLPHMYVLGIVAYMMARYAKHYLGFVRKAEPSFTLYMMQDKMMTTYFDVHGIKPKKKRAKI